MCVLSEASWPHSTVYSNEISYGYSPVSEELCCENRSCIGHTEEKLWKKILSSVVLHRFMSSLECFQQANKFISEATQSLVEADIPGWPNPSELHVVELKQWFKCRGANQSGRKADLVKRLGQLMLCIQLLIL